MQHQSSNQSVEGTPNAFGVADLVSRDPVGKEASKPAGGRELGDMEAIRPMDAVVALYAEGNDELSEAIIASLSRAVFGEKHVSPAGPAQRALARISYRILKWTTTPSESQ